MNQRIITSVFIVFALIISVNGQQNAPIIETTRITDNLYKFFIHVSSNSSVNMYALTGDDGILLIDAGYGFTIDLVQQELKKLNSGAVKYIINTHSDGDHTDGNAELGKEAIVVAHELCRTRLQGNPAFSPSGYPAITFTDSMKLHFNKEEISLKYFPGHTDGDIVVHFEKSGYVFLGDLVFTDSFPVVHPWGNIYLQEKSIGKISEEYPAETIFLVGHGDQFNSDYLKRYLSMAVETRETVIEAIKKGQSPIEADSRGCLNKWKSWNSKIFPQVNTLRWIATVYQHTEEGKKHSATHYLTEILNNSGVEEMVVEFQKMKDLDPPYYFFNEDELNGMGYNLLFAGKVNEAIEVFKINTDIYPESANVYDSLGEAYMNAGKKELAIKNYEKSLLLNPDNQNAINMIEKIKTNE